MSVDVISAKYSPSSTIKRFFTSIKQKSGPNACMKRRIFETISIIHSGSSRVSSSSAASTLFTKSNRYSLLNAWTARDTCLSSGMVRAKLFTALPCVA